MGACRRSELPGSCLSEDSRGTPANSCPCEPVPRGQAALPSPLRTQYAREFASGPRDLYLCFPPPAAHKFLSRQIYFSQDILVGQIDQLLQSDIDGDEDEGKTRSHGDPI